jgi:hypothetical protein
VDDMPLPPHPNNQTPPKQQQQQQRTKANGGPILPPKIERSKKPSKNGHSPSDSSSKNNSLDRHLHTRDLKMAVYDAYDPYNPGTQYDSSPKYGTSKSNPKVDPNAGGYRVPNIPDTGHKMHDIVGYRAPSLHGQEPVGYRAPSIQDPGYRVPSLVQDTDRYRASNSLQDPYRAPNNNVQDSTSAAVYNRAASQDPGYRITGKGCLFKKKSIKR